MCEALTFLLDSIYIRFGTKLFRQIVIVAMATNCAPIVADLFLFCFERDFMMSLSEEKQYEVIEAFSSTSRYSDDLLNIDNQYFDGLIGQINPSGLIFFLSLSACFSLPICVSLFLSLSLSVCLSFSLSLLFESVFDISCLQLFLTFFCIYFFSIMINKYAFRQWVGGIFSANWLGLRLYCADLDLFITGVMSDVMFLTEHSRHSVFLIFIFRM